MAKASGLSFHPCYSAASPRCAFFHAERAYSSRSRANFSWVDLNRAILAVMSARSFARRSSCVSFCLTDPLCSGCYPASLAVRRVTNFLANRWRDVDVRLRRDCGRTVRLQAARAFCRGQTAGGERRQRLQVDTEQSDSFCLWPRRSRPVPVDTEWHDDAAGPDTLGGGSQLAVL